MQGSSQGGKSFKGDTKFSDFIRPCRALNWPEAVGRAGEFFTLKLLWKNMKLVNLDLSQEQWAQEASELVVQSRRPKGQSRVDHMGFVSRAPLEKAFPSQRKKLLASIKKMFTTGPPVQTRTEICCRAQDVERRTRSNSVNKLK